MRSTLRVFATVAALLVISAAAPMPVLPDADRPHRIALVVGVSAYSEAPILDNPENDARAVAAELWESGYELIEEIDPDIRSLRAAIQVMADRLRPGAHAMFFFAGHGIQIDGENYLLAKDVKLQSVEEVMRYSVSANEIVQTLAESGAALSIVILDACRNNPLEPIEEVDNGTKGPGRAITSLERGQTIGLAPIPAFGTNEILIAYATAPGAVSIDGLDESNSPYTGSLVRHMATPGLEIGQLFRRVRADVRRETDGQQLPWINSSLESAFYFRGSELEPDRGVGDTVDTLGRLPPAYVIDATFWGSAVSGGQVEGFEAYLAYFPNGKYAQRARDWITRAVASVGQAFDTTARTQERQDNADANLPPVMSIDGPVIVAAGTQQQLALPEAVDPEGEKVTVHIAALPAHVRLFMSDGTPLEIGARLVAEQLPDLRYAASVDLFGPAGTLEFDLSDGTQSVTQRIEIAGILDACDLVAGYPHDPNRVGRGVRIELMKGDLAIAACERALVRYPDSPRFNALLGRAYRKEGRYTQAKLWNDKAIEAEYSAAISAEGKMQRLGQGGPVDYAAAVSFFSRAAELGDSWGQNALGEMYLFGLGVEQDQAKGLELIQASAATGNDWAHTLMGRVYEYGYGVDQSYELAFEWYRAAAMMGDVGAKMRLGKFFEHGLGVPSDLAAAYRWYESAAGQGVSYAQARFGKIYEKGALVEKDLETAVYWYTKSAEQGDPEGQQLLADALIDGAGVVADPERALALLEAAMAQGHARSMYRLASLYETGTAVEKTLPRALELYRMALEHDYPGAARPLARAYAGGYGGKIEGERAVEVLEGAVARGDPWAMRDLGKLLANGKAVPADPVRSATLIRQAAETGNSWALRDHARNLETGFGLPVAPEAAFATMAKAAETGNAWAWFDLARYYRDGVGTEPDRTLEAYCLANATSFGVEKLVGMTRKRLAGVSRNSVLLGIGLFLEDIGQMPRAERESLRRRTLTQLEAMGVNVTPDTDLRETLVQVARLSRR